MPVAHERSSSALYAGMKALLTCDNGAVVAGIVEFVLSQHRGLRGLAGRLTGPSTSLLAIPLILLNGLRCYAGVYASGRGRALVAARRPNERRAIAEFKRTLPGREWTDLVFAWRLVPVASAIARLSPGIVMDCRRTVRLTRRLMRRYGVFRALRAVELLAFYRRYCELLAAPRSDSRHREFAQGRPFDVAVMSSHSNPWGIALNAAARRFGVPIVLVTHGMPVRPVAVLDYDLAIVECQASRRIYAQAGCRMTRVVVKSRQRDFAPLDLSLPLPAGGLKVGICLSKDPVEARVISLVRRLLADSRVGEVLIRPHPINLWRGMDRHVASFGDRRIRVVSEDSLAAHLRQCDLVYAGNSTVLLDALIAGRPACYVRGLDHAPYDLQDFVRDGLVYEEIDAGTIDGWAIARFYERSGWPGVFRRYADVDRGEAEVGAAIRAEVQRLELFSKPKRGPSANNPTWCSAQSACHGRRLRAMRGAPFASTREVLKPAAANERSE